MGRRRKLSKRQVAYREYLKTPHWEALRVAAISRDGWRCCDCGFACGLQAHHLIYRARFEDTVLADLETLCRGCHRKRHGIGEDEYRKAMKVVVGKMRRQERPTAGDWRVLKESLPEWDDEYAELCDWELEGFAELIFEYVGSVLPFLKYGRCDWYLDERGAKAKSLAFRVRDRILARSPLRKMLGVTEGD